MLSIEIANVTKTIKGTRVLHDINLRFYQGKIYGLYGRNGSGKTMLLRSIAGLIFPTDGEILIEKKILHKDIDFPNSMGLIIENTSLLPQYTAFDNLKLLAKIKKIATDDMIINALKKVGLDYKDKRKVRALSLGMKQRLAIAQAIFEEPSIILLDEPTNALDEDSVNRVRTAIIEERKRGATIIIASHNKEDINYLVDEIIYLSDGGIIDKD